MSSISSIAQFSIAMSQAKLQTEVATRVLKLAQDSQSQIAAELVSGAVENLEEIIMDFAGQMGSTFDAYA